MSDGPVAVTSATMSTGGDTMDVDPHSAPSTPTSAVTINGNSGTVSGHSQYKATETKLGGRFNRYASAISSDNKHLFICAGKNIKIYSIATGALVGLLTGHHHEITAVLPYHTANQQHNVNQLITTSTDGTIRIWDVDTATCLLVYNLQSAILHAQLVAHTLYVNANAELYKPETRKDSKLHLRAIEACKVYTINLLKAAKSATAQPSSADSDDAAAAEPQAITLTSPALTQRYSSKACRDLAVHPSGQYIATIHHKSLKIHDLRTQHTLTYVHQRSLTTVKFHPLDTYIATGDVEGQIIIWYDYVLEFKKLAAAKQTKATIKFSDAKTKSLHWHAHTVWSLAFTTDGAYMLSGGDEGVLVSWQLATQHKHFLPRLGAGLCHITVSADSNLYVLLLADNSISIINAVTSGIQKRIIGLVHSRGPLYAPPTVPQLDVLLRHNAKGSRFERPATAESNDDNGSDTPALRTGLRWLGNSQLTKRRWLAINGLAGDVQLYDVDYDQTIGLIQVNTVGRNIISRMNDVYNKQHQSYVHTTVEHVAFNHAGDRMATVELRTDTSGGRTSTVSDPIAPTVVLKFWQLSPTASNSSVTSATAGDEWQLHTTITNPHKLPITTLTFHPYTNVCITSSTGDNTFRVWAEQQQQLPPSIHRAKALLAATEEVVTGSDGKQQTKTYFNCVATSTYRNLPVVTCSWSPDGSLLAVSHGSIITLWILDLSEHTLMLQYTMISPDPRAAMQYLAFSPSTPHLITASKHSVDVWNLLTSDVAWSTPMHSCALTMHDTQPVFAVVSIDKSNGQSSNSNDITKSLHVFDVHSPTALATQQLPRCRIYTTPKPVTGVDDFEVSDVKQLHLNRDSAHIAFLPSTSSDKPKQSQQHYASTHTATSKYDPLPLLYVGRKRDLIRLSDCLSSSAEVAPEPSFSAIASAAAAAAVQQLPVHLRAGVDQHTAILQRQQSLQTPAAAFLQAMSSAKTPLSLNRVESIASALKIKPLRGTTVTSTPSNNQDREIDVTAGNITVTLSPRNKSNQAPAAAPLSETAFGDLTETLQATEVAAEPSKKSAKAKPAPNGINHVTDDNVSDVADTQSQQKHQVPLNGTLNHADADPIKSPTAKALKAKTQANGSTSPAAKSPATGRKRNNTAQPSTTAKKASRSKTPSRPVNGSTS